MSIDYLGQSLLADAKASNAARAKQAQKQAKKEAWQGLGLNLLNSVVSGTLQDKAQQNYINNMPLQKAKLDMKNLAAAKSTYQKHYDSMMSKEGGGNWTTYVRNMLFNQYREELMNRSPEYTHFKGGQLDALANEWAENSLKPIVSAFQNAENLHDKTSSDTQHLAKLNASNRLLNPTTMGGWITSKIRRTFDGKTDDEVQQMAVNAIKNDPFIQANRGFLTAINNISGVRNKASLAHDYQRAAKSLSETARADARNAYKVELWNPHKTTDGHIVYTKKVEWRSKKDNSVVYMPKPNKETDVISTVGLDKQQQRKIVQEMLNVSDLAKDVMPLLSETGQAEYIQKINQYNETNKKDIDMFNITDPADYKIIAGLLSETMSLEENRSSAVSLELAEAYIDNMDMTDLNRLEHTLGNKLEKGTDGMTQEVYDAQIALIMEERNRRLLVAKYLVTNREVPEHLRRPKDIYGESLKIRKNEKGDIEVDNETQTTNDQANIPLILK